MIFDTDMKHGNDPCFPAVKVDKKTQIQCIPHAVGVTQNLTRASQGGESDQKYHFTP